MTADTILDRIVKSKRKEIALAKARLPLEQLEHQLAAGQSLPVRSFIDALRGAPPIRLIAEVKKASPSAGVIREDFDPVAIASVYQSSGAACVSVLTDREFFRGELAYLTAIRQQLDIPVLRKDFILDPYQVYQSRVSGADAVLLIAECLADDELKSLCDLVLQLGMTPLVELYDESNLDKVRDCGAELIGVNNRDLKSFAVDLQHTLRIRDRLPASRVIVSESGIQTRQDVLALERAGVDAMLVGQTLMAQADVAGAVRKLLEN